MTLNSSKNSCNKKLSCSHLQKKSKKKKILQILASLLPKVEELSKSLIEYVEESSLDPERNSSQKYAEAFKKNGVKLAYLFGSRARGASREDSDYDFAVLFNRNSTLEDEIKLTLDLAQHLGIPVDKVDVVALDKADIELAFRVLREGKPIYAHDEKLIKYWERNILIKALESRDIYNIYMKKLRKHARTENE